MQHLSHSGTLVHGMSHLLSALANNTQQHTRLSHSCTLVHGMSHLTALANNTQQHAHRIFPNVIKFRIATPTISEKAIRFRHPDYNPDQTQKLISLSMSRHLSISSKSMHAFLSNLANRQTDRQTNTGKNIYLRLCRRQQISPS